MILEWTPYLAVGVNDIDSQHKELFSRFNSLMGAMDMGNGKEELAGTVKFLEDYVVSHFGSEEELMDRYSYGATPKHKAEHAAFVRDFVAFKRRLETSGANAHLAVDVLRELADWLLNHVGEVDKQLGASLKLAMMTRPHRE